VSSVLFSTAEIVPGLDRVQAACDRHGATLLIDAYHYLNAVPFDIRTLGVDNAFITGGGYKYCQLGEGNCFLRVPDGCRLRPVLTGWFAEFDALERASDGGVAYAPGAGAFAGATYDPTSHYRAAAVLTFQRDQGLNPDELRRISCRQVQLLKSAIEALDFPRRVAAVEQIPDERRAGFLRFALREPSIWRGRCVVVACSSMRAVTSCAWVPLPTWPTSSCGMRWQSWATSCARSRSM
jgi:kynureninase